MKVRIILDESGVLATATEIPRRSALIPAALAEAVAAANNISLPGDCSFTIHSHSTTETTEKVQTPTTSLRTNFDGFDVFMLLPK